MSKENTRDSDVDGCLHGELEACKCTWLVTVRPTLPYKSSVWHIAGAFLGPLPGLKFRCVAPSDAPALLQFVRTGLSERSRRLFAPYPYHRPDEELEAELSAAIQDSVEQRSLSFIVTAPREAAPGGAEPPEGADQQLIVAHAFLWAMQSQVPELGIAVADSFQGQGLGKALVSLVVACARTTDKDAIELTTMLENTGAKRMYLSCGFQELGTILNPLGCDVPAAFEGRAVPTGIGTQHKCAHLGRAP
jgi:ribosomal protein S18 acetylase RimI-like enzyme